MEDTNKPWAPHEADILRVKNILTESHEHTYRLFYSQGRKVDLGDGMEGFDVQNSEQYKKEDTKDGFTYVFNGQAERIPAGKMSDLPRGKAEFFAMQLADFIAGIEYRKSQRPEVDMRGVAIKGSLTDGDRTYLTPEYKETIRKQIIIGRVHAENERIDEQRRLAAGARMHFNELPPDLQDIVAYAPEVSNAPVEQDPSMEDLEPAQGKSNRQ